MYFLDFYRCLSYYSWYWYYSERGAWWRSASLCSKLCD